jgi:hypothetical protein
MKEYIFSSYQLCIPSDWSYSEENNLVSFYDNEIGVGSLQISSYLVPSDYNLLNLPFELAEIIFERTEVDKNDILVNIEVWKNLAQYHIVIKDRYWEYYMFYQNEKLLFITYNCAENDKLLEKDVRHKIVQSIKII